MVSMDKLVFCSFLRSRLTVSSATRVPESFSNPHTVGSKSLRGTARAAFYIK